VRILAGLVIACFVAPGCGGVSEARVNSMEQQLKKLQTAQAAPKEGDTGAVTAAKVEALEASTAERFKKLEDMLELLQRAVVEAGAVKPAAAAGGATVPATDVWTDVNALLGIEAVGVEASGDNYTVKRGWLTRELRAMAMGAKGPKLAPMKPAGVVVRTIKPKSLVDQLGIKNGDVITAVGDTPVNSVEELSVALQKLVGPATVKIQRKKKEAVLQYTLKD
jgi:S1-C subfamily serine protease